MANTITTDYIKDEVPKAPVYLYAIETKNPYSKKSEETKFELAKLNKSLWLGEMLPTFDLVIPFNSLYMSMTYPLNPQLSKYLSKMNARDSTYHRAALMALV